MIKVGFKIIRCAKCGTESKQEIVYSVNFMLGTYNQNKNLMKHQQVCPNCHYTNHNISALSKEKDNK